MSTHSCMRLPLLIGVAAIAVSFQPFADAEEAPALSPDMLQRSLVNLGDTARLQRALAKARRGEKVVLAFIGGSITEGARATSQSNRYPEVIGQWWRKTFPNAQIVVLNAGIGATGSNFGALRIQRDVLAKRADVVVVEFAVNDDNSETSTRYFEGLIRQALNNTDQPAVLPLFMLRKDGSSAQEWFAKIGTHYNLPMVSVRDAVWPAIQSGKMQWEEAFADIVHPNDVGHRYTAQALDFLFAQVLKTLPADDALTTVKSTPDPLLSGLYESVSLLSSTDLKPISNEGWVFESPSNSKYTIGWKATQPGSAIEFDISGTIVFLQYWKINGPMGKVRVTIDGENPVDYDAWFSQTWGGYNHTQVIGSNLSPGMHRIRIQLLEDKNQKSTGTEFRITAVGSVGCRALNAP